MTSLTQRTNHSCRKPGFCRVNILLIFQQNSGIRKKSGVAGLMWLIPSGLQLYLETPGSGKSYAVVNSYIKQQIEKGFSQYIYDFKYPDLSTIAYNHLINNQKGYKKTPKFYVINFDDPSRSHRCNPINPDFMTDISDAYESRLYYYAQP